MPENITQYEDGYEDVPQAEIDALTRDDLLLIATDSGARRLVRCTLPPDQCFVQHSPGNIVSVGEDSLRPLDREEGTYFPGFTAEASS